MRWMFCVWEGRDIIGKRSEKFWGGRVGKGTPVEFLSRGEREERQHVFSGFTCKADFLKMIVSRRKIGGKIFRG